MSAGRRTTARKTAARKRTGRLWSAAVTAHSNALALERAVFTWNDPRRIAASLKRSAERSRRRKGTPYQSAMSMLTFYINSAETPDRADRSWRRELSSRKHKANALCSCGREINALRIDPPNSLHSPHPRRTFEPGC